MKRLKAISKTHTLLLTIAILVVVADAFPAPFSIVAYVQTHFITNNANIVTYDRYMNVKCPFLSGLKCQHIINGRQVIIKIYQEQTKEEYISKSKEILGGSLPHRALDTSQNVDISKKHRNESSSNLLQDKESLRKNLSVETNKSEEYMSDVKSNNDENPSDEESKYDKNLSEENEYGDDANDTLKDDFPKNYPSTYSENLSKKTSVEEEEYENNINLENESEEDSQQRKERRYKEHDNVPESGSQETRGTDDGMGETKNKNKSSGESVEHTDFDNISNEKNENYLTKEDTADEGRITNDLTEEEELTKENNEHLSREMPTTASILSGKWWPL